jgi:hypothetical protein
MIKVLIALVLRWAHAYARAISKDGAWIYAPPLVMGASNPIWRVAPPPRIREVEPAAPVAVIVTDPRIVAARRASLRLIIGSQSVT